MGIKSFVDKQNAFKEEMAKIDKLYDEYISKVKSYGGHFVGFYPLAAMSRDIEEKIEEMAVIKGDYKYKYNPELKGMEVSVLSKSKKEYGQIAPNIGGIPIVSLDKAFAYCKKMVVAPEIPPTVITAEEAFYQCHSLETKPIEHEGIQNKTHMYSLCNSLTETAKIPKKMQLKESKETRFNAIAAYAIKNQGISAKDLTKVFSLNGFEVNAMMYELQKHHVISSYKEASSEKFSATVSKTECDYLGIDVDTYNFNKNFINITKEEKIKEKDISMYKSGSIEKQRYVPQATIKMIPIDGNFARMRCGDLKTGDTVILSHKQKVEDVEVGYRASYEFRYNMSATVKSTGHGYDFHEYGWKENESQQGWGVRAVGLPDLVDIVNRPNSPLYIYPVKDAILGQPVTNMDYTYGDFSKLREVYHIPSTVTSIEGVCLNAGIMKTPLIPNSVENAKSAFFECKNLEHITNFPSSIKEGDDMFFACKRLSKEELVRIPDTLDASKVARYCGAYDIAENVLEGKEIVEDSKPEPKENEKPNLNTDDISI